MRNQHQQQARYRAGQQCRNRSGISTIWVIVAVPVVMAMFVFVLDIAHIWLARTELKNALDAAALSGAQTWGNGGSTAAARGDTNDAASANTVLGSIVTLDTTTGGCTNGNVSNALNVGEIVLGAISDTGTTVIFDCNSTPSCITGTFSVDIEVNTLPAGGGDTFTTPDAFRVLNYTTTVSSPQLTSIRFLLQSGTMVNEGGGSMADNGFFDFRPGGTSDNNTGADFSGIGTPDISDTFTTFGATGGVTASPIATAGTTPTSLQINFSSFDPNAADSIQFGVDTDRVGPDGGGVEVSVADFGGHFGTGHVGASGTTDIGVTVQVTIAGQTFQGILEADLTTLDTRENRSTVTIAGTFSSGGQGFAVRTRKTIQVRSIGPTFLGLGLGPYNVSAESFAQFVCSNGPPRLVHVDSITCVCP
jgi:Flp pilus assembly protein TadG